MQRAATGPQVLGVLLIALGAVLAAAPGLLGGKATVTYTTVVSEAVPVVVEKPVTVTSEAAAAQGQGRLGLRVYSVDSVMSAVYKVYGNPRLGFWVAKAVVENTGDAPLYDVRVSYKIEGYTDWSEPSVYPMVPPGGAVVDLYYPILPSSLAGLQTSSPSRLYVKVVYRLEPGGEERSVKTERPLTILGIHDFVFSGIPPEESTGSFYDQFSNYPLLAAWVTPKDPPVEYFADMANKLSGGAGAALSDEDAVAFLKALWDLSLANDITYQTEPAAFWTGKAAQWVKYPRDVLRDRSGTCLDTALFYASLAMAHGLRAYIVLMPGHAFPLVELPSGTLVPIETTLLNEKASFADAVEMGVRVAQEAFSGPFLVVDVEALQAEGIVPPELPPVDVRDLGLVVPGQAPAATATTTTVVATTTVTATATTTATGPSPGPAPGYVLYVNRLAPPAWQVEVPAGWSHSEDDTGGLYEVDFSNPGGDQLIAVLWSREYSVDDLRGAAEAFFEQQFGEASERHGPVETSVAGEPATAYGLSNSRGFLAYVVFSHQGYSFMIVFAGYFGEPPSDFTEASSHFLDTFEWR